MRKSLFDWNRRAFLGSLGAGLLVSRELFAETLFATPRMTEGPFYPDKLPLDQDNDLIRINDSLTPAIGEITHLTGKIMDMQGAPLKEATIEIWQCDANQVYIHTSDSGRKADQQDRNFQGYGRFTTGSTGEYRFRTIKPVPYPGRPAPHIHMRVNQNGRELLTTQLMVRNHPGNARDGIFRQAGDLIDAQLIQTDFTPIPESKIGELAANFNIVVGLTPDDRDMEPRRRR